MDISVVADRNQEVSGNMYCGCGHILTEGRTAVTWNDTRGYVYIIRDVPYLQCHHNGCYDSYYPGDVELNLSILADEMENGDLPNDIVYEERF